MIRFCSNYVITGSGVPPSPRSDHAAAVHVDRYLLIFGGGSHATCYNDLHVLDLQTVRPLPPLLGSGLESHLHLIVCMNSTDGMVSPHTTR